MTTNIALNQPAYNSTVPTWDQPLNNNATILDKVFGNTTSVSVNTGSTTTYTLITAPNSAGTGSTSQCMRFNLTGNLAADQYVLLPTGVSGMWIVTNATTGSFAVNIASNDGTNIPAGTAVSVPQGYSTLVYSDSVNVKKADDGTTANPGVTSFSGGTTGLTPSAISTGAITLGGTLIAANGGTGLTSPGPNGNVLTSNGTAWVSQAATSSGVSSFSTGTTGLSVNSSTGAVTLSGTLGVANGGTGQTTYTNGQLLIGNTTGNTLTKATLTAGTGISITNGAGSITISTTGGSGTVTSVGLSAPAMFSVSGSPVTGSGTLTLSYSGSALPVANGGTGQTTYTNGQLLIGDTTGNTLTKATLTAGSGVSITNGAGSITVGMSGSYTGTFTATSNIVSSGGNVTSTTGYVGAGSTSYPRFYNSGTYYNLDYSSTTGISYQSTVTALSFGIAGTQAVTMTANSLRTASTTTNYADNGVTTWNGSSDISLKKDVTPLVGAAQRIANLNPVNFTWKKDERADWGFIAQEFETVYPRSVSTDENGIKAIGFEMKFWADIISMLQTLQNKIDSLEARLTAHNL